MELKAKKCHLAPITASALNFEEKLKFLQELGANWQMIHENKKLSKIFQFKNFKAAWEMTQKIVEIAELENHHPQIILEWGKCSVTIWTHTHNDLLENDFILAAKIENLNCLQLNQDSPA